MENNAKYQYLVLMMYCKIDGLNPKSTLEFCDTLSDSLQYIKEMSDKYTIVTVNISLGRKGVAYVGKDVAHWAKWKNYSWHKSTKQTHP